MKKVLYITIMIAPYRTRFFNRWAETCDLTVVYESGSNGDRNKKWQRREPLQHRAIFLDEEKGLLAPHRKLIKLVNEKWDVVIIGCCNMGMERWLTLYMRFMRIPYVLNFDGESYFEGNTLRARLKRWFVKGADYYIIAGENSKRNLEKIVKRPVYPYYFSPLFKSEIMSYPKAYKRENFVLVVGQYFPYKGMDVMLKVALKDPSIKYKFVGMGVRQNLFFEDYVQSKELTNVEFIPFLQKEELEEEYKKCAVFVLPSRKECWGLVINEAASLGTPIVSTWGSGAAVEFLRERYPQYLAKPNDVDSLYDSVKRCLTESIEEYSEFLMDKAKLYTIERMLICHNNALQISNL